MNKSQSKNIRKFVSKEQGKKMFAFENKNIVLRYILKRFKTFAFYVILI